MRTSHLSAEGSPYGNGAKVVDRLLGCPTRRPAYGHSRRSLGSVRHVAGVDTDLDPVRECRIVLDSFVRHGEPSAAHRAIIAQNGSTAPATRRGHRARSYGFPNVSWPPPTPISRWVNPIRIGQHRDPMVRR